MGELFALISAAAFGASNVMVRGGMKYSRDNGIVIVTFINVIIFWALIAFLGLFRRLPALTVTGFMLFALAGLLTTFGGRTLSFAAIRRIGPSRTVSLRCSSPIYTIILAYFFLGERLTAVQALGAAGVLGGLWLLSIETRKQVNLAVVEAEPGGDQEAGPKGGGEEAAVQTSLASTVVGVILAVVSAVSYGSGHFFRKVGVLAVPSPYWGMAVGSSIAVLAMFIQALIQKRAGQVARDNFVRLPRHFLWAGFLSTFGQLFSYLSIYSTMVSFAVVLSSSEPLLTLAISRVLLRGEEKIGLEVLASAVLVFGGVVLIVL